MCFFFLQKLRNGHFNRVNSSQWKSFHLAQRLRREIDSWALESRDTLELPSKLICSCYGSFSFSLCICRPARLSAGRLPATRMWILRHRRGHLSAERLLLQQFRTWRRTALLPARCMSSGPRLQAGVRIRGYSRGRVSQQRLLLRYHRVRFNHARCQVVLPARQ